MLNTGLYWFTHDLRVQDNRGLLRATQTVRQLLCVYIVDPTWFTPYHYGQKHMGDHRWRFLRQTLIDLERSLKQLGQRLLITYASPLDAVAAWITQYKIDAVFRSKHPGRYEVKQWQYLQQCYRMLHFEEIDTHTLLSASALPFPLEHLPATFTQFRKVVEPLIDRDSIAKITELPPPPTGVSWAKVSWTKPNLPPSRSQSPCASFIGGANAANRHLLQYFSTRLPSDYKRVRNALDGWENSTKFSPWLANGSLSARQILRALRNYEAQIDTNDSTYWISFELLWREYFQWFARAHQSQLFDQRGIKGQKILTSFYPERFQRWCRGNTPFPLVNACMKQLNATGFMSNRGRQIVASCFVNELNLDWRYGAAYFEQQLIDYDVAANWGNWQYLAGVGADPRGKRRFAIDRQTERYDPKKRFIARWHGDEHGAKLDSVDAADWPIVDT